MLKSTERVQTEKDFKELGVGYSIEGLQSWHPLDLPRGSGKKFKNFQPT